MSPGGARRPARFFSRRGRPEGTPHPVSSGRRDDSSPGARISPGGLMPTIGASVAASLVTWVIDDAISGFANLTVRIIVSLVVSVLVYYRTRRYLLDLRGD